MGIRRKEDKFKNDARNGGMEGGCLPDQAARGEDEEKHAARCPGVETWYRLPVAGMG